jgi:NAD(P)H-dependent flavin oxidoreductase YrpB (nitropropane dioxygenase family)
MDTMGDDLVGDIDTSRHCMPCGQGAGSINDVPSCAEIIERVMNDARAVIDRLSNLA